MRQAPTWVAHTQRSVGAQLRAVTMLSHAGYHLTHVSGSHVSFDTMDMVIAHSEDALRQQPLLARTGKLIVG